MVYGAVCAGASQTAGMAAKMQPAIVLRFGMEKLMKHLVEHIRTGIYLAMCVLFTVLVYIYFDYIFRKSTDFWLIGSLVITGIVLVDYFARRYVTNIIIFFLIHLALIGLTVVIPSSIADKVILTIISASFFFMSVGFWKKDVNERSMYVIDIPLGLLMFFVMAYMHASFSKNMTDTIATYAYFSGVVYLLLFLIREYLGKVLSYTMSSSNFTKEMEQIFSTNISLIMLFNLITVFAIIIANMLFSDSAFNFIGRFLRIIARKLFGLLENVQTDEDPTKQVDNIDTDITGHQDTKIETHTVFSQNNSGSPIGEKIFEALLIILFVLVLFAMIYGAYRFIKDYMHKHNETGDIVEKVAAGEKKEKVEGEKRKRSKSFFGNHNDRVRRIYKEKINYVIKHHDENMLRESFTTAEIQTAVVKVEPQSRTAMDTLTDVYRRARYSDQEMTKEDVELAKGAKLR